MLRILAIVVLLLTSATAMAQNVDLPTFFTPSEEDLAVWYLGNIFGSELIQHGDMPIPDQVLMSNLFGMFNQVCMVVGIIIIIYTMLAGTLNTANEGKPLGEKWNSMWMPVRSVIGIALLVPKGGSGYVLSQYIVMWLTLQGIGAADTMWNTMVDFFEKGGAIRAKGVEGHLNYMTAENLGYVYNLEGSLSDGRSFAGGGPFPHYLSKNMLCVDEFNADTETREAMQSGGYSVYLAPGYTNIINFGDRSLYDPEDAKSTAEVTVPGAECGQLRVELPKWDDETENNHEARQRVYTNALFNLSRGLEGLTREITNKGSETDYDIFFNDAKRGAELFINYIVGYENILQEPEEQTKKQSAKSQHYDTLKRYGWILAGNYYTVLANQEEKPQNMKAEFIVPEAASVNSQFLYFKVTRDYDSYADLNKFWDTFYHWDGKYYIETLDKENETFEKSTKTKKKKGDITTRGEHEIGIVDFEAINKALQRLDAKGQDDATRETRMSVEDYIRYLTGDGSTYETKSSNVNRQVAQDPIIRAANYGKRLTQDAVILITIASTTLIALNLGLSWGACTNAWAYVAQSLANLLIPAILALGVFMYAQGAMLGIFLPLIPFVTFFVGAIGWMMQVVESIAAAPIVAVGLIFPETRDDIWGRAAPAYMLILNLFLRPSLMIIGFAGAMIMMWMAVELLNIGFLMLTIKTFRIEDMFGFVTIMTTYTGMLIYVATEVYSLITVLPNKVLHWIGDQSMGVHGAQEALGSAKAGAETGAGAVGAGYAGAAQKGDMYRAEIGAQKAGESDELGSTAGKAAKAERDKNKGGGGGGSSLDDKAKMKQ